MEHESTKAAGGTSREGERRVVEMAWLEVAGNLGRDAQVLCTREGQSWC